MSEDPRPPDSSTDGAVRVSELAPALRLLRASFVALALLAGVLVLLVPVDRMDLWPLLRVGEQVCDGAFRTGSEGRFEFAGPRERSFPLSWTAGCALHRAYRLGGLAGLSVLLSLLVVLGFALSGAAVSRRHQGVYAASLVALLALLLARSDHSLGAEAFSVALLGALCWYRDPGDGRVRTRDFFLAPVFFFIWANAHAGFVLGLLLLLADCAGSVLRPGTGSEPTGRGVRSEARRWLLLVGLSVVGAFVFAPASRFSSLVSLDLASSFGPPARELSLLFDGAGLLVLVALTVLGVLAARRTLGHAGRIRLVVLGAASLFWARSALLLALAVVPVLGAGAAAIRRPLSRYLLNGSGRLPRFFQAQFVGLHLLASLALLFAVSLLPYLTDAPTFRAKRRLFPQEVAELLRRSPFRGPILNSPEFGDYLAWQLRDDQPLAFGSRPSTPPSAAATRLLRTMRGDETHWADLEKFTCLVLAYPEQEWDPERRPTRQQAHLSRRLLALGQPADGFQPGGDPRPAEEGATPLARKGSMWRLIAWDDVAMVFARDDPKLSEFLDRHEIRHCDPVDMRVRPGKPSVDKCRAAAAEIDRRFYDRERPSNARALYLMGLFLAQSVEMAAERLDAQWSAEIAKQEVTQRKLLEALEEGSVRPDDGERSATPTADGPGSPFAEPVPEEVRERRRRAEEIRHEAALKARKLTELHAERRAQLAAGFIHAMKDAIFDVRDLAPDLPEAHYLMARGLLQLSAPYYLPEILNSLRKAVRLDPNYVAPRSLLAELLSVSPKESEVLEAREQWRRVLDLEPDHRKARYELARIELSLGTCQEAARLLEPLRSSEGSGPPGRRAILRTLAAAYELSDDYERAAECVAELREASKSPLLPEGDVFLKAYADLLNDLSPDRTE